MKFGCCGVVDLGICRIRKAVRVVFALFLLGGVLVFGAPEAHSHGPSSVADVAEKLQAAVVNISTSQSLKSPRGVPLPEIPKGSPLDEYFDDLFDEREQAQRKVSSLGSGFVIDPSGIIVTNYHVIEGAEEIYANFIDGTELKVVKVIGHDPKTDLAVLKVEPKKPLKAVEFGNSDKIRVGEWVMAIGNPFGLGGSVTVGIISAKQRDIHSGPYDDFIQTDAAINRGNSGGPLFDMQGKVIGVNTAIISPTGGSIGIGFAVPSDTVAPIVAQLRQYGKTRRGWLGVFIRSVTDSLVEKLKLPSKTGALVASVQDGSPAAVANLKPGDVITFFDGRKIRGKRALTRIVAGTPVDKVVEIEFLRDGVSSKVEAKIGLLPEDGSKKKKAKSRGGKSSSKDGALRSLPGIELSEMSDALRSRYEIKDKVKGLVITHVTADTVAAEKNIVAGDVIVEVAKQEVRSLGDVSRRIDEITKSNDKLQKVLLLISDGKGALRFVAVPLEDG